jgi:hypothetical protein
MALVDGQPDWSSWGDLSVAVANVDPGDLIGSMSTPGASAFEVPALAPGGDGGFFGGMDGMDKAKLALGGLQTIGGLWSAWQSAKLAKKSFKFNKAFANRNLENQTKTYNTAMDDRVSNRQTMYAGTSHAMSPAQAEAYLNANRLSTRKVG